MTCCRRAFAYYVSIPAVCVLSWQYDGLANERIGYDVRTNELSRSVELGRPEYRLVLRPQTSGSQRQRPHVAELERKERVVNEALKAADMLQTKWLQNKHAELLRDDIALRIEDYKLRQEDSALRARNANMRNEIAANSLGAKNSMRSRAVMLSNSERSGNSHTLAFVIGSGVAFFVGLFVFRCDCLGLNSNSETDEDDEETGMKELIGRGSNKRHSVIWSCCTCFCNRTVLTFTAGLILVSFVAGRLAWQAGILQPMLAQFGAYIYIVGVVAALVALLVCEVWRFIAQSLQYVMGHFEASKSVEKQANLMKFKLKEVVANAKGNGGDTNPLVADGRRPAWAKRKM